MKRIALVVMLLAASNGLCQTAPKESETMQALLAEVHQLRQAIESMTGASQRVQIALYTLQMQDASVARAAQRLDEAHNKCSVAEADRAHFAAEVERLENGLASRSMDEAETKAIANILPDRKRELEAKSTALQTCQGAEAQVSSQYRNEQAKLTELQDRITRLDQALAKLGTEGR